MASASIRRRLTKRSGVRYLVVYRLGDGKSRQQHGGTFATEAQALRQLAWIRHRIAAGTFSEIAESPYRAAQEQLVYIAELGGVLKIGISVDPARRCEHLHAELLHTEIGGRSRERELHDQFAHLRTRGEWFRDDPELRSYIASRAREPEAVSPLKEKAS